MTGKVAAKLDTKMALLEVGMDMMLERGYTNTGIQEVLNALSVPKGSFYHYFESKETYAVEIIRHYDLDFSVSLMRVLRNPEQTPIERLRTFCANGRANFAAQNCRKGCLVGNLSQEMSDQSEALRHELSKVMGKWCDLFAACIDEGQKMGGITNERSARELAEFFLLSWGGAVMWSKTLKSVGPIDVFMRLIFEDLLVT
jgi:TetR/AcrR family transcriptional repressor of nem operon